MCYIHIYIFVKVKTSYTFFLKVFCLQDFYFEFSEKNYICIFFILNGNRYLIQLTFKSCM